jgi:hypothetical protein
VLGFGCGAVGGLIVRGDPDDQERTIARAIAAGVNYFDTAVQYGNGESETNLGRVLQRLKPANRELGRVAFETNCRSVPVPFVLLSKTNSEGLWFPTLGHSLQESLGPSDDRLLNPTWLRRYQPLLRRARP